MKVKCEPMSLSLPCHIATNASVCRNFTRISYRLQFDTIPSQQKCVGTCAIPKWASATFVWFAFERNASDFSFVHSCTAQTRTRRENGSYTRVSRPRLTITLSPHISRTHAFLADVETGCCICVCAFHSTTAPNVSLSVKLIEVA